MSRAEKLIFLRIKYTVPDFSIIIAISSTPFKQNYKNIRIIFQKTTENEIIYSSNPVIFLSS